MLDLLIKGGLVVDGTGAPGFLGDVGIRGGNIASVSKAGARQEDLAARVIDGEGCVVAPGFIDIHTHYDAQLLWDPAATPSPLHGVTTVIGGNCGFGIAPAEPVDADYITRMMARVEGMPLAALQAGVDWKWRTFGEWLNRLDGNIAINAGFLAGHSTVRRVVMGAASVSEEASTDQISAMAELLHQAMDEGALGFSSSRTTTHNDGDGNPVPSRAASTDELVALAATVRDHQGTTLEIVLPGCNNGFVADEIELMTQLSIAGNRPINWNLLRAVGASPEKAWGQLEASDYAAARGGRVVALTLPLATRVRISFATGFILDALPGWAEVIALPIPLRMEVFGDPEARRRLNNGARSREAGIFRHLARWERLEIGETFSVANEGLTGQTVGEIAARRGGADPFDVLCEIIIADELRTVLHPPSLDDGEADWALRAELCKDPRTVVGGSDAGAHLDMMCGAVYTTALLARGVRDHGVLTIEEAVQQLTSVPAALYGLGNRGRIGEGMAADIVVFDPATVGPRREHTRDDLPAGATRLYSEADGIAHVLVNGIEIACDGALSGDTPGTLLRSGRDTMTITATLNAT